MAAMNLNFLRGYTTHQIFGRLSRKNRDKDEILAMPTSDIDAEYSKLNILWRNTLIGMYRERQAEILSLSKLAVHFYDSSRDLKKSLTKEKKKKGEAKSALERMRAELADQFAKQQSEMERMKAEHADESAKQRSQMERMKAEHADESAKQQSEMERMKAEHADQSAKKQSEMESLRGELETQTNLTQYWKDSHKAVAADNCTALETIKNLEKEITALKAGAATATATSTEQPAEQIDLRRTSSVAEAASLGDEDTERVTEQDDDSPAPNNDSAGPALGLNGKPLIPRKNRRADGSVRTASHPEYVPPAVVPSRLGDRPEPWRGDGFGRGGGGRNGGRGGRGNRRVGAPFGWRGGRGRGGGGGGGNGQFGQ